MSSRKIMTLALALGLLAACGDPTVTVTHEIAPPADGGAALPAALFTDTAPEGARNVSDVKADAHEGDVVVIRGRVGGPTPFVPGRAVLSLADAEKLTACTDREGDTCPTPWDYCCESKDDITSNTATVQVVGADGRPLKVGLEGAGGIDALDFIVVTGKVGPRPDPGVLVIDATSIHVEP